MATNPMLWAGSPRSYTPGRARPVQYVALHYTAGSEGPSSAEGGVAYDKNRTDGTSCHAFFDSQGPGLQEVGFGDRSHSAYFYGNEIGVHFEICGTVQTRAQWLDPVSMATLRTCAAAVVYTCDTLGLARRRLSVDEVRAAYNAPAGQRPTGFCDHAAITAAYGLGDHTDVGPQFPWDVFMNLVGAVGPAPTPPNIRRKDVQTFIIQPEALGSGIGLAWPSDEAHGWVFTNILPPGAHGDDSFVPMVVDKLIAAGAIDARSWKVPSWAEYTAIQDIPGVALEVGDVTLALPPMGVALSGSLSGTVTPKAG